MRPRRASKKRTKPAICLAAVAALASLHATATSASAQGNVVVLASRADGVKPRYEKRLIRSLREAVKEAAHVSLGSPELGLQCGDDPPCVARAGKSAGSDRVVAVRLAADNGGFSLSLILVDTASGRVMRRTTHPFANGQALRRESGAALVDFLASGERDSPEAEGEGAAQTRTQGTPVVKVQVVAQARGDGRTVIDVPLAPEAATSDLSGAAKLPHVVECIGAVALPAIGKRPPAILAPAIHEMTRLSCAAHLGTIPSPFEITLERPGAGLYARARHPSVRAGDAPVELHVFAVEDGAGHDSPSGDLRAAASAGTISRAGPTTLSLALPKGNAPRMIAIALADGERAGAAFVSMWGTADLPVKAALGSQVMVAIAGRWQGPIATEQGIARVPILVPPGVRSAFLQAKNRAGYVTESVADLETPDFPRLAVVAASESIAAKASTQLVVALAGADGRPAADANRIAAEARRGRVGPAQNLGGGLWVLPYTAPAAGHSDEVVVHVAGDPRAGRQVLELGIVQGPRLVKEARIAEPVLTAAPVLGHGSGDAYHVGAYGEGGFVRTPGFAAPRVGAGLALLRTLGPIEAALLVGAESFSFADRSIAVLAGSEREVGRSLLGISVPVALRGRVRLARQLGASLRLGLVPTRVAIAVDPGFQAQDSYAELVLGVRAQLVLDAALGPGRAKLGAAYGWAKLTEGLVVGQLEGTAVLVGYEWWFAGFDL